jgi:hypothetical protein
VILNTDPSASYSARCVKWPARKAPIDRESSDRFPALFILDSVAASEFLAIVGARRQALRRSAIVLAGVGTVAWACATSYLWFSGLALAYGKPNETEVAEQTTSQLEPGTLVIADLWHPYGPGKLTYVPWRCWRDTSRGTKSGPGTSAAPSKGFGFWKTVRWVRPPSWNRGSRSP